MNFKNIHDVKTYYESTKHFKSVLVVLVDNVYLIFLQFLAISTVLFKMTLNVYLLSQIGFWKYCYGYGQWMESRIMNSIVEDKEPNGQSTICNISLK